MTPRHPEWMRVRAPGQGAVFAKVEGLVRGARLTTVCEEAGCPNIGECWNAGTATFQILGEVCTRACRYCNVTSGRPSGAPDPFEPARVARAAAALSLEHVVVTSVDRDDLPDGGAAHFAATIRALRSRLPGCSIEVLTPDFHGVEEEALASVLAARPSVFNHNIETVERLHRAMRGGRASYRSSLQLLGRAKARGHPELLTKSGIIVGLGETTDEIVETLRDLRAHGVDMVTIGQYLRPTDRHAPVARWLHPDEFGLLARRAEDLGFRSVMAGPLVRSSYRASAQVEAVARHTAQAG